MNEHMTFGKTIGLEVSSANISNKNEIFMRCGYKFLGRYEGVREWAYDDATGQRICDKKIIGKVTVGIGFNMDATNARNHWGKVLDIPFDDVYFGKIPLQSQQVKTLFAHSVLLRINELHAVYHNSWNCLKNNEQLAITSAYFNSPKIVGNGTKFKHYITEYTILRDEKSLSIAAKELQFYSNPKNIRGIQSRREAEAALLLC